MSLRSSHVSLRAGSFLQKWIVLQLYLEGTVVRALTVNIASVVSSHAASTVAGQAETWYSHAEKLHSSLYLGACIYKGLPFDVTWLQPDDKNQTYIYRIHDRELEYYVACSYIHILYGTIQCRNREISNWSWDFPVPCYGGVNVSSLWQFKRADVPRKK